MPKILHVGKFYPPFSGGIENFMADLLAWSANASCEVAAIVHHHEAGLPFSKEIIHAGSGSVVIYRVPCFGTLLFTPLSPRYRHYLKRAVHDFAPDLLHVHVPNVSAFWISTLKECRSLPTVVHWHADVVASRFHRGLALAYRFYRPFEQALLRKALGIIVTSPPYLNSSAALEPWRGKCRIVPLGLAPRPETPSRADGTDHDWGPAKLRVLCVGRLTYYKGHEHLIRAVAGLDGVKVVIVGQGEYRPRLARLVEELQVEDKVCLHGHATRDQLLGLLRSCDCFCLPSIERTEAFGLVLLEAMRETKACVVTDVAGSGMSWVVQDSVCGLVVKAGDDSSLRKALARMRDDGTMRLSMAEAARRRYLDQFTIERAGEEILSLYAEFIPSSTSGPDI